MSWRDFKTQSDGIKVVKVGKPLEPPPFTTLNTLIPPEEILKTDEPAPDLFTLIGETLAEIDGAGRPWTGWRQSLTAEHCRRLKEAERDIDRACLANDRAGVVAGLEKYRKLTIDHKENTNDQI